MRLEIKMDAKLLKYTLSEDRHGLTGEWEREDGSIAIAKIHWDFVPDDAWVQHCIELQGKFVGESKAVIGEKIRFKRIGPFILVVDTGPPIWWLPHFKVFKWGFGARWFKVCFGFGYGRKKQS